MQPVRNFASNDMFRTLAFSPKLENSLVFSKEILLTAHQSIYLG